VRIRKICEIIARGVVSTAAGNDDEFDFRVLIGSEDEIHKYVIHGGGKGIVARGPVEGDIEAIAPDF
jgi:hypothetical protein